MKPKGMTEMNKDIEVLREILQAAKIQQSNVIKDKWLYDNDIHALTNAISALEAQEKLIKERDEWIKDFNTLAKERDKLQAELTKAQKEVEDLRVGKCEHIKQNTLDANCKLCDLAIAEKGYLLWVKKAKELQAELSRIKGIAPELLKALKYARRFLRPQDVDTDYIDKAIAKANKLYGGK